MTRQFLIGDVVLNLRKRRGCRFSEMANQDKTHISKFKRRVENIIIISV